MSPDCDIAVVGGGPVGAALALALLRAGFDTRLIERDPAPAPFDAADYDLRVYAISAASARFLDGIGVWAPILRTRASAYEEMRVWSGSAARALRFNAADTGTACLGWIVEQHLIRRASWDALPAPALHTETAVLGARFDERGATLELAGDHRLRPRLLISAEGAGTVLRDLAGIEVEGWSYAQHAVVCHLHTSVAHQGVAVQRFLPDGPLAFLPLADGRRSIVWSTSPQKAQGLLALPEAEFLEALLDAIGPELGGLSHCTRRLAFPLRLLHARDYVRAGFALVGDAAHLVHPLAGQGANLGYGDAEVLVETLVEARAQRRDWSGERVLRGYQRRRKAANSEMLALTDLLNRGFRSELPGLRPLLDHGMGLVGRTPLLRRLLIERALG